jgi:hypothetical protein
MKAATRLAELGSHLALPTGTGPGPAGRPVLAAAARFSSIAISVARPLSS